MNKKHFFKVAALFLILLFVSFSLCAQSSGDGGEKDGKLLMTMLIIAGLVIFSFAIYAAVKAMKGEAIFYCGMSDFITAMIPLVMLIIGIGILEWKPIFTIITIGCAIFYNLFMSFSLNSGKLLLQITIFLSRMTIGYLSLAMLIIGFLIIIVHFFGGFTKNKDETPWEHEARRARNLAFGVGLAGTGGALMWKLINAKPGDLTEQQRGLTALGKVAALVLMAACLGGWYFIDSSKAVSVQAAEVSQVAEATSSGSALNVIRSEKTLPSQYREYLGKVTETSEPWKSGETAAYISDIELKDQRYYFTLKSLDGKEAQSFETSDMNEIKIIANSIDEYKQKYPSPVYSLGYPESSGFVNDYASFVDPVSKIRLNAICKELDSGRGVQLVLVTINSLKDFQTGDETLESFATNLFNAWGIGNKDKNDGILVLVLARDRVVRVELGMGYGHKYDNIAASAIDEMLPSFQKGENGEGLIKGAEFIIKHIVAAKQNEGSDQEMSESAKDDFVDNSPPPPAGTVDEYASEQSKITAERSQERSSINIKQSQETTEQPMRISNEQRPEKIKNVVPVYPPVALKFNVQGVVSVEVMADKNGMVIQAKSISGPPLLLSASLAAVKQWIYEPYISNGRPRPVIFTVAITYSLKNGTPDVSTAESF